MKECLSEEILQQYFDGELAGERMERAALHLAGCKECSALLRELETETDLLSSALAPEFSVAVPSEQLHRRIEAAIAGLQVVRPVESQPARSAWRSWLEAFTALLSLSPQRAFAYASLVAILAFATLFGISKWRSTNVESTPRQVAATAKDTVAPPVVLNSSASNKPSTVALVSTGRTSVGPKTLKTNRTPSPSAADSSQPVAAVKLLPGERTYLKTIAALDTTINSGNRTMRPALQAEYERNLALVDRAIAATRSAAKSNPNDPDAAEFMFAAYQSKVDLLNTIADARVYNRQR